MIEKVCVLDTETTGLSFDDGHRIIEIAALVLDMSTFKAIDKLEQRISPGRSIDPKAQLVHGISLDDLVGKPKFKEVEPALTKMIDGCDLLVAHNLTFDAGFLIGEYGLLEKEFPEIECFDTMTEFRWATPMGKLPNLKELCFACDVEYKDDLAHAAMYDVIVLARCFINACKGNVVDLSGLCDKSK